ncbi:hypothetical protein GYMLUDRAFT_54970 [Collybiopsis luxurians FD-317 M1]|nr:hypothetical protein GYMLUDRAFT_54970 [Collybiopsis luxurians FD-317 M1]
MEDQEDSSSEDLRPNEGSEFVTDLDTETEAGFTTEAEMLSDSDELRVDNENGDEEDEERAAVSEGVRELLSDDDELEFWDNNDYIVHSSNKVAKSPSHSSPILARRSQSQLVTPPRSQSTYSESYLESVEPIVFSPPPASSTYWKTRSRSRARSSLPANESQHSPIAKSPPPNSIHPVSSTNSEDALNVTETESNFVATASRSAHSPAPISSPSRAPPTRSSGSTTTSSALITSSFKIPRIDLALLSRNQKRGRSHSRSPSKPARGMEQDTVVATTASKLTPPLLSHSNSIPDDSPLGSRRSLPKKKGGKGSVENGVNNQHNQGKSRPRVGEINKNAGNRRTETKTIDIQGRGKAPEVIEILDDDSEETYHSSRLSTKAKGKKRARSFGTPGSSEEEFSSGSGMAREPKVKPMGSPTKKGRYAPSHEGECESSAGRTSAHYSSQIGMSAFNFDLPYKLPTVLKISLLAGHVPSQMTQLGQCHGLVRTRMSTQKWGGRRNRNHRILGRNERSILEYTLQIISLMYSLMKDENDYNQDEHGFPQLRARLRTHEDSRLDSSSRQSHYPRSESIFDDDYDKIYPMHGVQHSKSSPSSRHRHRVYSEYPDSDLALSPEATQRQMQRALEGRAKHIISNAIQSLYSLLTPEGLSAVQDQVFSPTSHRETARRVSLPHSPPNAGADAVVYTRRKSSGTYGPGRVSDSFDPGDSISSSPPHIPLLGAGSSSASHTTPTSQDRRRRHSFHTIDPKLSRGTLPPSSPISEDSEFGRGLPEIRSSPSPPLLDHAHASASQQGTRSSPLPRTSSIVQRSRSRGRRVSFKEIAMQTQTNMGETKRTLSREISVEDAEEQAPSPHDIEMDDDMYGVSRRESMNGHNEGERRVETRSSRRKLGTLDLRERLQPRSPSAQTDYPELAVVQRASRRSSRRSHTRSRTSNNSRV